MLRRLIHRIFEPRHYWRDIGFDELSELYTSQLLRSLAVSLIGLFTPIYLYSLGYSLVDIALFHVWWNLFRPAYDFITSFLVAKFGPKHMMLVASIIHVVYLGFLLTLKDAQWPLFIVANLGTLAYSLHVLSIETDFSKIKHPKHGGKELSYLAIVERVGGVIGPLVGGLIANYFDPRYTVGLAMITLLVSAIPLFISSEPTRLNQDISYRRLPVKSAIVIIYPYCLCPLITRLV
jgi:MFS family permease